MKTLLLIIPLLLLSLPAAAQEICGLALADAPALFNLKLGISPSEARRAAKLSIKNKPESVFFQNYIKQRPPAAFPGVRVIYLRFFDSKLYQIEIFYENETPLEGFVDDLSARESLPREAWKIKHGIAELKCAGFSIRADNVLNPRIELTDPQVKSAFEASQDEKKKNKKAKQN